MTLIFGIQYGIYSTFFQNIDNFKSTNDPIVDIYAKRCVYLSCAALGNIFFGLITEKYKNYENILFCLCFGNMLMMLILLF